MKRSKIFGNLFEMNKSEKNGVLVLIIILFLIIVFRFFIPQLFRNEESSVNEIMQMLESMEQQSDGQLHKIEDHGKDSNDIDQASIQQSSQQKSTAHYFEFDPNKVTKDELIRLGLSDKGADIFINFRNRGAIFRHPTDLLKVYSIDSSLYKKLEPYISIPRVEVAKTEVKTTTKPEKEKPILGTIEINSADSAMWTTLPGIGPVFAGRICRYREKLGGFSHKEQLLEVYNFSDERYLGIASLISVDTTAIRKININFADSEQLRNHPYCGHNMARKVIMHRSRKGSFHTVSQLLSDSLMSLEEYNRLAPYLNVHE